MREQANRTRERMREQLRDGRLDDRIVELEVRESAMPSFEIIAGTSVEEIGVNLKDMMGNMFQGRTKTRRLKVPRGARAPGRRGAGASCVDMESVSRTAVQRVEQAGIIFIDEIDKIASRDGMAGGGHGGPTSAAKACSATSCRSSKGRPSTPSTGWSRPITSCSSPPARFTSRSRRT